MRSEAKVNLSGTYAASHVINAGRSVTRDENFRPDRKDPTATTRHCNSAERARAGVGAPVRAAAATGTDTVAGYTDFLHHPPVSMARLNDVPMPYTRIRDVRGSGQKGAEKQQYYTALEDLSLHCSFLRERRFLAFRALLGADRDYPVGTLS